MKVAVLGQVAGGRPVEFLPITQWRDIRPPKNFHWSKRYLGLEVVGDSMSPYIEDGDIVIFEITAEAKEGQIIVAMTPDGLTCKYLHQANGKVLLRSHNQDYLDQQFDIEDIMIKGVVCRVERDIA